MGFEQRRSELMAKQPDWGDSPSPPSLSKQVEWPSPRSQSGSEARESSALVATCDEDVDCEPPQPVPDDLIMREPKARKKPIVKPRAMISCQDWTLETLVRTSKNFHHVPRIRGSRTRSTAAQIQEHEDANQGVPLVVEGLHKHPEWIQHKFTPEWFEDNGPTGA
jgi:hypothetical protein